ncbi:YqhR family membrane protein [Sporolactobacillus sp. KGMB 08714]|uniref:YqhR family membrane protein n=1 Tax=Sporolactobacillus sp. KGMB 08714 TaxID=3064704 RepID=UPI002FBE556A
MARRIKKTKKGKKNKQENLGKSFGRASVIGVFSGLIWSSVGLVCHLLNFSSVAPSLLFAPLPLGSWKQHFYVQFIAIACIGLISIAFALLYQLTLSRFETIWIGIAFGIFLWCMVFFALQPWIPGLPPLKKIGWNTMTTTLCLFVLYGLFIGYSIAFKIEENSNSENYSNE